METREIQKDLCSRGESWNTKNILYFHGETWNTKRLYVLVENH